MGSARRVHRLDFAGNVEGNTGDPRRSEGGGARPNLETLARHDRAEGRGRREGRSAALRGRFAGQGVEGDPRGGPDRGDELLLLPFQFVPDVEEPGRRPLGEQFPGFGERLAEPRQARFGGAPVEFGGDRPEVLIQTLEHCQEPPRHDGTEAGGERGPFRAEHGKEVVPGVRIAVGAHQPCSAASGDGPDHAPGLRALVGEPDRVQLGERMGKPWAGARDVDLERPLLVTRPLEEGERQVRPPSPRGPETPPCPGRRRSRAPRSGPRTGAGRARRAGPR